MIVVAGTVVVKQGYREAAEQIALKLVEATKKEQGCLTYDFWTDLSDPYRFHVFEEWESDEALEAHFQTAHMAAFLDALPGVTEGPPEVKRYEVTAVSQLL